MTLVMTVRAVAVPKTAATIASVNLDLIPRNIRWLPSILSSLPTVVVVSG